MSQRVLLICIFCLALGGLRIIERKDSSAFTAAALVIMALSKPDKEKIQ